MRILLLSVAICMTATAAPAQLRKGVAGPPPPNERIPRVSDRIDDTSYDPSPIVRDVAQTRDTIHQARETGTLTRRESRRLSRENDQIGVLADRYSADGLSASERAELEARAAVMRDQVNLRRLHGQADVSNPERLHPHNR